MDQIKLKELAAAQGTTVISLRPREKALSFMKTVSAGQVNNCLANNTPTKILQTNGTCRRSFKFLQADIVAVKTTFTPSYVKYDHFNRQMLSVGEGHFVHLLEELFNGRWNFFFRDIHL